MSLSTPTKPEYNSPEDWINWSRGFRLVAGSLELWQYIDPATPQPWPRRPIRPQIKDYEARPRPVDQNAAESSTRMQTRGLSRTVTASNTSQTSDPLVPILFSDLTPEGRANFEFDWSVFVYEDKKHDKFVTKVYDLTDWVLTTISAYYLGSCCLENTTIDQWYRALQRTGFATLE